MEVYIIFLIFLKIVCTPQVAGLKTDQFTFTIEARTPYIKLRDTIPSALNEFTLCYWVRPHNETHNNTMTVFSYSVPKRDDEILAGILIPNRIYFRRQSKDRMSGTNKHIGRMTSIVKYEIGRWLHVCVAWSTFKGYYRIVVNGNIVSEGYGLAVGQIVDPGGIVILGQDQDVYGGSFQVEEGLQGDLAEVNLWDYLLCTDDVFKMSKCEFTDSGNILSLRKSKKIFYNGVQMGPGKLPCGQCY